MKRKILLIGVFVLVAIAVIGYNIIYKDHRDIKTEEAEFTLTATELSNQFIADETKATAKYADKTIVASGKVTAFDPATGTITVDEVLSATLKDKTSDVAIQTPIKIKGRFVGYDDLLGELKMDQVTLIK